jgi:hypothetical protein
MRLESYYPFLLIIAPFVIATVMEALTIYFFKLKPFWAALAIAISINLLSLVVLYGGSLLAGKLGYSFNGLQLPPPVVSFFWWLSVLTDGLLLQLFSKKAAAKNIYLCSTVMNTLSWLFLYFFITNN